MDIRALYERYVRQQERIADIKGEEVEIMDYEDFASDYTDSCFSI